MTWIHEISDWPDLTWSLEALAESLARVRYKQGLHLGRFEDLGFSLRGEASLETLTEEIVKSSAIEGEVIDSAEVRSSIARHLGMDLAGLPEPGRQVEGVVELMLDATRGHAEPLTAERLFGWHAALFPTGRSGMRPITVGAWRPVGEGEMSVVSRRGDSERVHFQAPSPDRLEDEMNGFLEWFAERGTIDPVLRSGVAHFWFVTIHPFEDGNGRIARAIGEMALAQADGTRDRTYSMSSGIEARRAEYYQRLESAQRGSLDITAWLAWFLDCLEQTLDEADEVLGNVLAKARILERVGARPVSDRQRIVVQHMLDTGDTKMTTSKYAVLVGASNDTALRDIQALLENGILARNESGGRSTSYRLADG
jgi:Fic family protein